MHFFWGRFDLAVTRFSGRRRRSIPEAFPACRCGHARGVFARGEQRRLLAGRAAYRQAAFYSYAYPTPTGFAQAAIDPPDAVWSKDLGEWLLPYERVRSAADPEAMLLRFLQSTYRAAAWLGNWDPALECAIGKPDVPRPIEG